jgi:5-(carboxyamino)imidazole ribonucleotide synthase
VLGIEQGSTDTIQPAIMINLIGEIGYSGDPVYEGLEEILKVPGVFVHLYGKHETRPFRKMGHITILAPTQEELRSKASLVQGKLKIKA